MPKQTAGIFGSNASSSVISGVDAPANRAAIEPVTRNKSFQSFPFSL